MESSISRILCYIISPDRKAHVLQTLKTIITDHIAMRSQIGSLAIFEIVKQTRGAVLGWLWLFIKPATYIFVFWFALHVGLRVGSGSQDSWPPYIVWLASGLMPWFFMQDIINKGSDVFHKYSYLVNKIKFPLSAISTIFTSASMIIELGLILALFLIYFISGMPADIYLLQVPIILLLMYVFWDLFSMMCSHLSAMSKDFYKLLGAFSTPLFWLSGIIFNVKQLDQLPWIQAILDYNPVTFFVTAMRDAFYHKVWFWEDASMLLGFVICFVLQLVVALIVSKRLGKEVPDVL